MLELKAVSRPKSQPKTDKRTLNLKLGVSTLLATSAFLAVMNTAPILLLAEPAQAQTVADILKRIEKKAAKVEFQKSRTSLPQTIEPQLPRQQVNLKDVKPPETATLYYKSGSDEAELEKATDASIKQLFELSQKYGRSSRRGELWLRLAELYVEKARLIEFRIHTDYNKRMENFLAKKAKQKPKLDLASAQVYNRKSIQLYEWFVRDYPNDPKMDQALFFLGFNYFELNEPQKGLMFYERLTREYPQSAFVTESNFALGEYHFENEKWSDALKYYTRVVERPRSRLYTFGLYKSAWCYYKMNQSRTGMEFLEKVILAGKGESDDSTQANRLAGVSQIRLATESVKDLIVFYAESGDPEDARSYFERVIGKKGANANLAKLAYFYEGIGKRESARIIFKDLISQDRLTVRAYDYQYAIVKMYLSSGRPAIFKEELYSWIQDFGPLSNWQKANQKDQESVAKANQLMEQLLRNNILFLHKAAQNAQTKTARAEAKEGYSLYFDTFTTAPKLDEMHFYFAELLYEMEEYAPASENYNWVVVNNPKSAYFERSVVNELLSLEQLLPSDKKIQSIVGESNESIEFDPTIKNFEAAALRYFQKVPNGDQNVAAKYRLGGLHYMYNHFDDALKIFREIIEKYPKTQYAKNSANHMLDIYNIRQDYTGLQDAANSILSVPALARSDIGGQIRDIKMRTEFKLAKELEDKKEFAGSAVAYRDFATKNPNTNLTLPAQFNAGVNFERAGDNNQAILLYGAVANNKSKGNDDLKLKAARFLPILLEKSGQYQKAAAAFESFSEKNPKDSLSEEYLFNAAVIYDGLNFYEKAIGSYEKYFQKQKKRDRVEVLFLLAKLNERLGRTKRAIEYYDDYLKGNPSNSAGVVEAAFQIAVLSEKMGNGPQATEWYKKTVSLKSRMSRNVGVRDAAAARFKLVSKTYDELVDVKIVAEPKAQAKAVKLKLALLNRLKEELKTVIKYDDALGIVSALTLQGRAFQHMGQSLLSAPLPAGLNAEESKQYKEQVAGIANPFFKQAAETYKGAIDRGHELTGYGESLLVALRNYGGLAETRDPGLNARVVLTNEVDVLDETTLDQDALNRAYDKLGADSKDKNALNTIGVFFVQEKKYGAAKIVFNRILRDDPNDPVAKNNMGVVLLRENELRAAIDQLRASVAARPSYRIALKNLSSIYLQFRDYKKALEPLEEEYQSVESSLSNSQPNAINVANNYAVALMGAGELGKAEDVFNSVLAKTSRQAVPALNFSILLIEGQKKNKEALKWLSKIKFWTTDKKILSQVADLEAKIEREGL
jgi:tetratricopeptide (TPR) repeat protein